VISRYNQPSTFSTTARFLARLPVLGIVEQAWDFRRNPSALSKPPSALGVDESGEAFHKALRDVLKPKKGDGNN
jgi:hypothetical protein